MTNNSDIDSREGDKLRVIISGGGTGGHIFPALSIAEELRRRFPDAEIQFVGAENRMEMDRVPKAGFPIIGLPVAGFDRKRPWRNFKVLYKLWKSMRRARRIIRNFKPMITVGVGGYASGPVLKQAQKAHVPTLIQEQNSYAGVTNKLLAKNARCICVAYPEMERFFPENKIVLTGNPVRSALLDNKMTREEAKKALGFPADRKLILVVGGSLGARTINLALADGLDRLHDAGVSVLWQTGKNYADTSVLERANSLPGIKAVSFIDDMGVAYRAADLVVSRAGASSISELELLAKPVILVPSPNVAEDHQRKNALALSSRNAAILVLDDQAAATLVDTAIKTVQDTAMLDELSKNIARMALPDSAKIIVDNIIEIINSGK